MSDPNFPYTIEGLDPDRAWKVVDVEDPGRIGVLLQLREDHAGHAAIVLAGDTVIASLRTNGDLRIAGGLRAADGVGGSQPSAAQVLVELATPQSIPNNGSANLVFDSGVVESHGTGLALNVGKDTITVAVAGVYTAALEIWFDSADATGMRTCGASFDPTYFFGSDDFRPAFASGLGWLIFTSGWTDYLPAGGTVKAFGGVRGAAGAVDVVYAGMAVTGPF
jgi:hypothetical protein